MRPKSIATVVVAFDSTPTVSSTPMLSLVRYSSVSSGWISLTAPTRVVLPTPKPAGDQDLQGDRECVLLGVPPVADGSGRLTVTRVTEGHREPP